MSQIMAAWLIFFAGMCFGLLIGAVGDWLRTRSKSEPLREFLANGSVSANEIRGYQPFDSDPHRAHLPPGAE